MAFHTAYYIQGSTFPAVEDRLNFGNLWTPDVSSLKSRSGIHPDGGSKMAVTANGTPNMSVNVGDGSANIQGTLNALQGSYSVVNDAVVNRSIAAANASLPRQDLVAVRIRDAAYTGAVNDTDVVVLTGTAAASPTDPAIPTDGVYFVLARVAVAANATSITSANITDLRQYSTALGGITPANGLGDARDVVGAYIGQYRHNLLTGRLERWTGSAWGPAVKNPTWKYSNSSSQLVPSSTWTSIGVSNSDVDTDAFRDGATNYRAKIPTGLAGTYLVGGTLTWISQATNARLIRMLKNGNPIPGTNVTVPANLGSVIDPGLSVSTVVTLAVGDTIELQGYQDSGATLGTRYAPTGEQGSVLFGTLLSAA